MTAAILALVAALAALAHPAPPDSLADLPRGAPPAVGYVDHGTWRGPDGRTVDVPDRHGISAIAPYDGGFFIADTRYFEGSVGLARVDSSGRIVDEWATGGPAAVAPNGSVAWASFVPLESGEAGRSLVHRLDPCGRETVQEWPERAPFSVAGLIQEQIVVDGAFQLPVELLDPSGTRTALGLADASDVSGTLVAGNLDPDGYRSGVVDTETGNVLWRTSAYGLTFSPSGRRVVGETHDGLTVFRRSDGHVMWQAQLERRAYTSSLAWEDEHHLLAVTQLRRDITIVRFGHDEEPERATVVERGDPFPSLYVLPTQ